ncbi:hypothetical protein ASPVEDRAFT_61153 [Aspergillus versicolor CBS 583.65]|uniref:Hyaluronan/mRNA-binding protein domain-containing protein n=1 Tax=Aspergillus versicolor CBS 583.65 TaxID=1036611 RepID=A0A1L9PG14_ASPVE|nr:uncharacterized protein ASPVEDRAFT_61153 [Aspergillus versicolor CBS 583.65]OJJ00461.1 hypothetical protein ASPVEDRAFT_61153 [Aspergillus versicolor CBS 583.65]
MADVRSKNLYELLGNDPELDPNREPEPPTRALDKPVARLGKRDAPKEAPTRPEGQTSRPRGGRATGNEAAFRDRNAGRGNNRDKPVEESGNQGNRGGRGPRRDRQSRTGQADTRKQVNQGWGNQDGEKTWDDERAADNIAKADENEPQTPAEEEEPVDKSKSFADYLAEKAAREDLAAKPVRAANEGSKSDKKWAGAKEIKRSDEEEAYIQGKDDKSNKSAPKQRKEKNYLDVDMRFVEAPRTGGSAPRGRGRGGGRGAGRGDRGSGRGGRGNGPRSDRPAPVTVDEKNFPSLGGK